MRHKCVGGIEIATRYAERTFPLPRGVNFRREENKAMNIIKQTFLICAIALGLSAVAFGQKDDKKTPPKPPPPVIKPGEKPKNEEKPKKPISETAVWRQDEVYTA